MALGSVWGALRLYRAMKVKRAAARDKVRAEPVAIERYLYV